VIFGANGNAGFLWWESDGGSPLTYTPRYTSPSTLLLYYSPSKKCTLVDARDWDGDGDVDVMGCVIAVRAISLPECWGQLVA
jgi:hypothetical protein